MFLSYRGSFQLVLEKIPCFLVMGMLQGHSRFLKTYHGIKKDFFSKGIKIDVQNFVAKCMVCQ
jgi:hypothetical protein